MTNNRIVVAGSSGLLGSALTSALEARGDTVVRLIRTNPRPGSSGLAAWDPASGDLDPAVLAGADAVIVLNGVPIGDKRWNDGRKALILSSRLDAVGTVARTMAAMHSPPSVLMSASAIGFYGERGNDLLTEAEPAGEGFFADVCDRWEAAADPARAAGIRVVTPRTGLVLSGDGGALKPMVPLFKLGIGGRIGDGQQWWSWIAEHDWVRGMLHCLDGDINGPVNLVAPNPVTNEAFTKALGATLHRPTFLPVPKLGITLRLGRELADAVGYVSHRVDPSVLRATGFEFEYPTVTDALTAALG